MKQIKQRFKLAKETKNTYVYNALKEDAAVTTIYIQRSHFEGRPPRIIKMLVAEVVED